MTRETRVAACVLRVVVAALFVSTATSRLSAQSPLDSLSLRAHVRFLASDLLEGRANGTRGQHLAAEYIAAQFERLGLEPLDAARSFRQQIPLTRVRVDRSAPTLTVVSAGGRTVIDGRRFYHFGGDSNAFLPVSAPVQYIGALRSDLGDVRGKIIVAERTPGIPVDSAGVIAEAAGARALILLAPDSALYADLRNARGPYRYFVRAKTGTPSDRRIAVLVADPGTRALLRNAYTATLDVKATFEPVNAWNMIARLPGTSPELRERPLIYSAHYDHIGYARPVQGDSLYNGFMDNAVGVAAVLAIAEALRPQPLRRPVLFLLTAAEEEGSLGAAFAAAQPLVPLANLTAIVNLDAGAPLAPPNDWYIEGGDHPVIQQAMKQLVAEGMKIQSAPLNPSSDHWPFFRRGVPAAFPVQGDSWGTMTQAEQDASIARWWRQHRPQDEWDPSFPLAGLQAYASFALRLGRALDRP